MSRPSQTRLVASVSAAFLLACALFVGTVGTAGAAESPEAAKPDTLKTAQETAKTDTTAQKPRVIVPDSTWLWPANPRADACEAKQEYPETPGQCWRQSPRRALSK
jgi:hypothetical protein